MTLDDIKHAIGTEIDKAWNAVVDTVDVEAARTVATGLTSRLSAYVLGIEAHLFNHVADNANQPATVVAGETGTAANPADPGLPPAAPVEVSQTPVTDLPPAVSAPDGSTQLPTEPPTGMAPPAGDPAADTTAGA